MFSRDTYTERRKKLKMQMGKGMLLFLGHDEVPMNGPDNTLPFHQNSTFLYYFGLDFPGLAATIDIDSGEEVIYGDDIEIDDIVWMGPQTLLKDRANEIGVEITKPAASLHRDIHVAQKQNRKIHFLPEYLAKNQIKVFQLLDISPDEVKNGASVEFIKAVISQRSHKSDEEIRQIEQAHAITYDMHTTAMKMARPGAKEQDITGVLYGIPLRSGGYYSFPIILSTSGEILHNHSHNNVLQEGDMLLVDCGAENSKHYAADITRVTPVSGKFTSKQKEIYDIVLAAEEAGIAAISPGTPYKEVHLKAAKIVTNGLKDLGLMRGNTEEAVKAGAHALFFPHGLGHMMGLDVHDMEDLGENFVGYNDQFRRSDQFGLAYLRLAKKLKPGYVLTVEPGIYFIPALINDWSREKKHSEFLNYKKIEEYIGFGGIRIEDDVLVTESGYRVIGEKTIPKKPEDVEAMWGEKE